MTKVFNPRLCGSTLFMLLTEAQLKGANGRNSRINGIPDPTTEPGMLGSFMRILWPSVSEKNYSTSSLSTTSTAYKKGKYNNGGWLNLEDPNFFNEGLQNYNLDPRACLIRTKNFFKDCISDNSEIINKLGRRLLELIYLDETISDDVELAIKPNFSTIKKKDISTKMPFMIEPLLLGLIHYIVKNEIKHTEGALTYEEWYGEPNSSNVRPFISKIGNTYFNQSTFNLLQDDDDTLLNDEPRKITKNNFIEVYDFSEYLENLKIDKSSIKTFLYKEGEHSFDEFYVCSDIYIQNSNRIIKSPTAQKLRLDCSQYIVISGTGGLGKSMLMNHLVLRAIDSYQDEKLIPVFISLNEIKEGVAYIYDYIFECIQTYSKYLTKDQFSTLMKNGSFLFLLDGLDEIQNEKRIEFEAQINNLTRRYSGNVYIISSRERDDSKFHSLDKFSVINILPFDKDKAIEMVDKLDYGDDKLKAEFKKQLDHSLFYDHKEFASNPLLLTIMLLTYEDVGEIQKDSHKFFEDAYRALSRSHDSHKSGYHREYQTNSTGDIMEEYLVEFSFLSIMDGIKNFTLSEFQNYFEQTRINIGRTRDSFTCQDFMDDLMYSLCLLQNNKGSFSFVHQSFQEYFCAKYLAKIDPEHIDSLIDYFNDTEKFVFEKSKIFKMIFEMEPNKIRKYIFIPFLRSILEDGDSEVDKYLSFLTKAFGSITYGLNQNQIREKNTSILFLYKFITEQATNIMTPRIVEFIGDEYLFEDYVDEVYGWKEIPDTQNLYELVPLSFADKYDSSKEKVVAGYLIHIPVKAIVSEKMKYSKLINVLMDISCDLKEEYNEVKRYYEDLVRSISRSGNQLKNILKKNK